jgi:PAS domain-containing protein
MCPSIEHTEEKDGRPQHTMRKMDPLYALMDAVPSPIWVRDANGQLVWANAAYGRSVGVSNGAEAVAANPELLDTHVREAIQECHARGIPFVQQTKAIVGGARRIFEVIDVLTSDGSAGIGRDATNTDADDAHDQAALKSLEQRIIKLEEMLSSADRRTQDTFEAVYGTVEQVVDRLAATESGLRDRLATIEDELRDRQRAAPTAALREPPSEHPQAVALHQCKVFVWDTMHPCAEAPE